MFNKVGPKRTHIIDRRVSFFSNKKKKNRIFDKLTQNIDYFSSKKRGFIYLISSRVLKYYNNNN